MIWSCWIDINNLRLTMREVCLLVAWMLRALGNCLQMSLQYEEIPWRKDPFEVCYERDKV